MCKRNVWMEKYLRLAFCHIFVVKSLNIRKGVSQRVRMKKAESQIPGRQTDT